MGLHHATLKAAVGRYGSFKDTLPADALKAEIAKDEKGFTPEEVDEIYEAIVSPDAQAGGDEPTAGDQTVSTQADGSIAPEWAVALQASNEAVIASNVAFTESVGEFKEFANKLVSEITKAGKASGKHESAKPAKPILTPETVNFDPEADYVVVKGQSFWDRNDHTREYKAGEDVTHLGEEILRSLLARELVEED